MNETDYIHFHKFLWESGHLGDMRWGHSPLGHRTE